MGGAVVSKDGGEESTDEDAVCGGRKRAKDARWQGWNAGRLSTSSRPASLRMTYWSTDARQVLDDANQSEPSQRSRHHSQSSRP
jgi:hypothetical protein